MSRLQRRLLAAVGILSLVVTVAIVVVSNVDRPRASPDAELTVSDRPDDEGGNEPDDSAVDETSAVALAPVRGGTALPQTAPPPPPPPPPTEAPSTTTTTAPPALTAKGTSFEPARDTTPRAAAGSDCRTLASPGWTVDQCGTASAPGGATAWLIEEKGKGHRAMLLESAGVGQWRPLLVASDEAGGRWSGIKARVAEGPGGAADEIIGFGFRSKTGGVLVVDLVHRGEVAAHVELAKGAARVSRAQLDTWAALPDGTYRHDVIRWSAEAWRVVDTEAISAALVPPSHL